MWQRRSLPSWRYDTDQEVRDHFDQRANTYEKYSRWTRDEALFRACTDVLATYDTTVRCLDMAGGTGRLAAMDPDERHQWWTLDLSFAMALNSERQRTFVVGDAHSLPLRDATFAHIVLRSALHYLRAEMALSEARRVCTSSGHVVIAQKVGSDDEGVLAWQERFRVVRNPVARYSWTTKRLHEAMTQARLVPLSNEFVVERRSLPTEEWLDRAGTIDQNRRREILSLLYDAPHSVKAELNLDLSNNVISFDRTWCIIVADKG